MPGLGAHTILVLDDGHELRDVLRRVLDRQRWLVLVARNSHDAIAVLHAVHVDVIVVDLANPPRAATELLAERSREPRLGAIPTIVTCDDANPEVPLAGIIGLLHRPFATSRLIRAVVRCVPAAHAPAPVALA